MSYVYVIILLILFICLYFIKSNKNNTKISKIFKNIIISKILKLSSSSRILVDIGDSVGTILKFSGALVGSFVGVSEIILEGICVGVGDSDGNFDGCFVGDWVGKSVFDWVGKFVGDSVGEGVGSGCPSSTHGSWQITSKILLHSKLTSSLPSIATQSSSFPESSGWPFCQGKLLKPEFVKSRRTWSGTDKKRSVTAPPILNGSLSPIQAWSGRWEAICWILSKKAASTGTASSLPSPTHKSDAKKMDQMNQFLLTEYYQYIH